MYKNVQLNITVVNNNIEQSKQFVNLFSLIFYHLNSISEKLTYATQLTLDTLPALAIVPAASAPPPE